MTALTFIEGVGRADRCDVCGIKRHSPVEARDVWHHIRPKVCGGLSSNENLVQSCDNGHYSVHDLMWRLQNAPETVKGRKYTRGQRAFADRGWREAVAAGTAHLIPKEA